MNQKKIELKDPHARRCGMQGKWDPLASLMEVPFFLKLSFLPLPFPLAAILLRQNNGVFE
jgi:hypothetical protein